MAPKAIGFEDFAVLEECKGMRNHPHHQTPNFQYPQHQMSVPKREAINSYDAAKIYGGVLIMDNRRNKNPPIDCFEAAQKYGGVLLVDNRKKTQPLRKQAYYYQLQKPEA